jgi:hypothetical protein
LSRTCRRKFLVRDSRFVTSLQRKLFSDSRFNVSTIHGLISKNN